VLCWEFASVWICFILCLLVDDGSGVILCIVWKEQYSNNNGELYMKLVKKILYLSFLFCDNASFYKVKLSFGA